jgi:uncharacterized RDD family membrane protein YckC
MKPAFALWLLLVSIAFGAEAPNLEEPARKTDEAPARVQPERKSRKRSSSSRQDLVRVGSRAELKAGESCSDFVVIGSSAQVDGHVHGDLVAVGATARLGPTAVVDGDTVVVGGLLQADPAAVLSGERVLVGSLDGIPDTPWLRWPFEWVTKGLLWGRPLPHQFWWSWTVAGIFLLLNIGLALLFPRPVQTCVQMLGDQPGSSFLAGLLALGLFLPAVLLLVFSVIGAVMAPFLVLAFVAAFFLGEVVVYAYAGQQVGAQLGMPILQRPLLALVCGTLVFYFFYAVPVLGFLVWFAVAPLAVGTVTLATARRFRPSHVSQASGTPVPVTVNATGAAEGVGAAPSNVLLLPRVGFWKRFLAMLIDAVLFLLIVVFVERVVHVRRWIPLLWTAYHVALWTWTGTTVGGLVFRLKIVRTDGRPINFAVALVRSLASFLSAAVLFLGFFWAGWTQSHRSWHDRIAGTVVVKLPKGATAL